MKDREERERERERLHIVWIYFVLTSMSEMEMTGWEHVTRAGFTISLCLCRHLTAQQL